MAAAEALRDMLRLGTDVSDKDQTAAFRAELDKNERVIALGLSGAQYGAAINLAACLLRDGPIEMMNKVDDDRRIQISAYFPTLPPLARTDQEPAHG